MRSVKYEHYSPGKARLLINRDDSHQSFIFNSDELEYLAEVAPKVAASAEDEELATPEFRKLSRGGQ